MKLFNLLLFALIFSISSASVTPSFGATADTLLEKAKKLHVLYLRTTITKDPTTVQTYERRFFYEFPNNFKQFNALYGTTKGKPGYLNEVAEKHIDVFNSITNVVPETTYFSKVIALAADGVWDIEAPSYLQNNVKTRVVKNPPLVMYILETMPLKKVANFWYFYFDCMYPEREISESLKKMTADNPTINKIMLDAHRAVLNAKDSDDNPVPETK